MAPEAFVLAFAPTTEVVYVPADPPRAGAIACWDDHRDIGADGSVDLVLPSSARLRRRTVPARLVPVRDALPLLLDLPPTASASARMWSSAALSGLGLLARGRLQPALSDDGYGAWRAGPLDPSDRAWLAQLAKTMPPLAYALARAGTPLRVPTPGSLVRAFWDALADAMVRTPAAAIEVREPAFAAIEPVRVEGPTAWLTEIAAADHAGATVVLRMQAPAEPPETDGDDDLLDGFSADLLMRSVADPSLLVDVADLWDAPVSVLTRLGSKAESDLLLGLRRGARAWPPLGATLAAATPEALDLGSADVEDLLGRAGEDLAGAGIEVLWPAELFAGELRAQATIKTAAPPGRGPAGFSLDQLLEFTWRPTLDGEVLSEAEVEQLAEAKRSLVRLRGRWVRVDRDLVERLRRRRRRSLTAGEALAAALTGIVEVDGEQVEVAAEGVLAELAQSLRGAGEALRELEPSSDLLATLRPYQRRGLAWLAHVSELGFGGCLADDMGLGKTLQLIALHLHRRALGLGPTLVICPTTLLGTWRREIERFAPGVSVRRFHGTTRDLDDLGNDEVVLTTYGVVRSDHERLASAGWGLVVADEAQHAKNPNSRTAKALRTLPAPARVALTGTPVENRLSELWSILDWTTPGLLGPLQSFQRSYAVPVERYRDAEATDRLARLTRPFLLRRRKSDPGIAPELPPKTESDVVVGLTAEQATLYEAVVRDAMAKIAATDGIERRGLVLGLLTALKQVCNHPAQLLKETGPLAGRSGKLAALDELLTILGDEGESVLVFTQYVAMGRLLERHLADRGLATQFLHGGVTAAGRERMVADFQAGVAPIFLLSLKAGGVGLTLTKATHVVHYDRWWNPAVEDQATDRAYRIGQDKPVQVHRLITEGTVEDRVAELINSKRALADAVVGSGEGWLTELSDSDLAELVRLGASS